MKTPRLKIGIMMESSPQERKGGKVSLLEVIESDNFTIRDLALKKREVNEQIKKDLVGRGYHLRSISVVADSDAGYDVVAVVQAPIFGASRKKPVRRAGPMGGGIGRGIKK